VGELAARHLKRAHLELGGNNALVVLPGVDLDKAVSAGAFGSFLHQGQICMTAGRHLVHESLAEEYLDRLAAQAAALPVGDPAGDAVALGPLIDEVQLQRVDGIVQDSLAAGARLAAGGTYEGLFYRPTVLAEVDSGQRAWREEIFGPVAPVRAFSGLDELIAAASDVEYGLSLGDLSRPAVSVSVCWMGPGQHKSLTLHGFAVSTEGSCGEQDSAGSESAERGTATSAGRRPAPAGRGLEPATGPDADRRAGASSPQSGRRSRPSRREPSAHGLRWRRPRRSPR
jgi:Aldehyde dehydrogenase family